ncbi:kinase-like domain-containing protein [Rhizophagus irregularis DAOM 181602=DAOM 197198]|nr:kinase-like domain-containing protein [Rhizophagus irregularis DAOM 181602=DAOM 197198]
MRTLGKNLEGINSSGKDKRLEKLKKSDVYRFDSFLAERIAQGLTEVIEGALDGYSDLYSKCWILKRLLILYCKRAYFWRWYIDSLEPSDICINFPDAEITYTADLRVLIGGRTFIDDLNQPLQRKPICLNLLTVAYDSAKLIKLPAYDMGNDIIEKIHKFPFPLLYLLDKEACAIMGQIEKG